VLLGQDVEEMKSATRRIAKRLKELAYEDKWLGAWAEEGEETPTGGSGGTYISPGLRAPSRKAAGGGSGGSRGSGGGSPLGVYSKAVSPATSPPGSIGMGAAGTSGLGALTGLDALEASLALEEDHGASFGVLEVVTEGEMDSILLDPPGSTRGEGGEGGEEGLRDKQKRLARHNPPELSLLRPPSLCVDVWSNYSTCVHVW